MTRDNPRRPWRAPRAWSRHYQDVWSERAADQSLPNWIRLALLAYGSHCANGHANFSRGALRLTLGRLNQETGEIVLADAANVRRALAQAVKQGWLAEGSTTMCLIVPAHAIEGGLGGRPEDPCPIHERIRARKATARSLRVVS